MKKEKIFLLVSHFIVSICFILLTSINTTAQDIKITPTATPSAESFPPEPKSTPDPNAPRFGNAAPSRNMGGGCAGGNIGIGNGEVIAFNPPIKKGPFKWERISSSNEVFSVEMPSNYYEVSEDYEYALDIWDTIKVTERRTISSFLNGTFFILDIYKTKSGEKAVKRLIHDYFIRNSDEAKCSDIKLEELKGYQCELNRQVGYAKELYFYDKQYVYVVIGHSLETNNVMMQHFFSSIRSKEKKTSQKIEEINWVGSVDEQKGFTSREVTQKAIIVLKVQPIYTTEARKNQTQGIIRITAILGADGIVRSVRAVTGLPNGLTERAMSAAKRIRFIPARKNGVSVSQYVTLEYNFHIY